MLPEAVPNSTSLRDSFQRRPRFPPDFAEDEKNPTFLSRFHAEKSCQIVPATDSKDLTKRILDLATEAPHAPRTILFVESPAEAAKLKTALSARVPPDRVAILTGEQRGHERDKLAEDPLFQDFLRTRPPDLPCWMIATSAGEVGVNLSCSRLITTLATADHLLQRFGRLNALGKPPVKPSSCTFPSKRKRNGSKPHSPT